MKNLTSLLIISLICLWSPRAPVFASERHQYVEMSGAAKSFFSWEKVESRETVIRVKQGNTLFENYCDQSGATLKWHYESANTDILVNRRGNRLHMTGTDKGKKVDRYIQLDDFPWYQPLSYSFRHFLASDRSTALFWIIRSDNLKAVKMKAVKGGVEEIYIGDNQLESFKIKVCPMGLAAYLWCGEYWYRISDGLFVKFRGTKGLPGASETTVELLPPNQPKLSNTYAK